MTCLLLQGWLLLLLWCRQSCMPAHPTGDYLKWCHVTYQPSKDPVNWLENLGWQAIDPPDRKPLLSGWVPDWTSKAWLGQGRLPLVRPAGCLSSLQPADVAHPERLVKAALDALHSLLQQPLQDRARSGQIAEPWMLFFHGKFLWNKPAGLYYTDVCICYNKQVAMATAGVTVRPDGYLLLYVGTDVDGKPLKEYAHRLVCLAYHGGPTRPRGGALDWKLVVSHQCNNTCCLNPRHLQWVTQQQNSTHPRGHVGKLEW